MSTVESPVTQITETAVNNASTKGAGCPDVVAAGSENSRVKIATNAANTRIAKRAGPCSAKSPIASENRAGRLPRRFG